jgi:hypothetical protein
VRKYRSFAKNLLNRSNRPFAVLPDQPGTCGERRKAVVGATGRVLQEGLSDAPGQASVPPENQAAVDISTEPWRRFGVMLRTDKHETIVYKP